MRSRDRHNLQSQTEIPGVVLGREEALLTAAERRFRPIMMTALTTICGMVPVALSGATGIGLSHTSFGLTLIGGLTTCTAPLSTASTRTASGAVTTQPNLKRRRETSPSRASVARRAAHG